MQVAHLPSIGDSGSIIKLADELAAAAAISTEAAIALLLWLGSVCMIQHAQIIWPDGMWQPAGLVLSIVEEDHVAIDSITNSFVSLARSIGVDPINETVKEGPAGLIARLESAGRRDTQSRDGSVHVDSLHGLASINTEDIAVESDDNTGNARALIYPSGRAFLSYLYDTPFFNVLDELIQHGNLNVRGKTSNHRINHVHINSLTTFFQGSLVTMTNDSRVQNNMSALLRQMLVFWPTSGTRRYKHPKRIDTILEKIRTVASEGLATVAALTDGTLLMKRTPAAHESYITAGAGIRYTVLNRETRINKLAIGVAFWRVAFGGGFELTKADLAVADALLHSHEMGGRLYEHAMGKGKVGHEMMRVFLRLLDGESLNGEEIGHATDMNTGQVVKDRLSSMGIINADSKLEDDYRYVKGTTIRDHKQRWKL